MLFFTDWLGVSLRLPADVGKPPLGYVWNEYTGTNVWEKRRVMWSKEGERILTLLNRPKASIIDQRAALCEIDNALLYRDHGVDDALEALFKSVNYEILGLSRLDLAVDFCPNNRQKHIIEGLAAGTYYVQGKINGSQFWSTSHSQWLHPMWRGRKIPHCISWGHKTSAIKWKLYYKTKELVEAAGDRCFDKPYIVDQWQAAGMDVTNVWRLEVSIHNCNQFEYKGKKLSYQLWEQFAAEVYASLYQQRFQIRKNQGHKDKTNDKIVQFLGISAGKKLFAHSAPRNLAERNPRITLLRHLVASLDDEAVLIDDRTRENVLWLIEDMVKRDGLQNYFRMMCGEWVEEYIESQRVKAYDLLGSSPDLQGFHGHEVATMPINTEFDNQQSSVNPDNPFERQMRQRLEGLRTSGNDSNQLTLGLP